MARYETPDALKHDARMLADDTRALLDATAEITDQKIAEARQRLLETFNNGKQTYDKLQKKARQGVQMADETIRENPYQSIAIGFGVGVLIGILISRRD
jgi:ElaB/YqjD/DUF883 family membrane-anchored ribosome-binding protein